MKKSGVLLKKRHLITSVPVLIWGVTFLVYLFTLSPYVPPGDSGEFITAAYVLGVPHPPGYPLFTMLGHLFTKLPWGTIAWRVNLMSAIFHSLTVVLVYFISLILIREFSVNYLKVKEEAVLKGQTWLPYLVSASASLTLAFSPLFWHYSLVAEVFSLNDFFAAALVLTILIWRLKALDKTNHLKIQGEERPMRVFPALSIIEPTYKFLYLFALLYGLAMSNHHTIILLAPGFLFLILSTIRKVQLQYS